MLLRASVLLAALTAGCSTHSVAAGELPPFDGVITYDSLAGEPYSITFDNRSLFVNGRRSLFHSFGLHLTRSLPGAWPDLFAKAKADGYNMIQTYVFWNQMVPKPGDELNLVGFAGNGNLTAFLQAAKDAGLFVNLRIGPYVCAEWNFGGFPLWITDIPGLVTRTSAPAWEQAMGTFFQQVVNLTRPFFADKGGPIAIAQVENELSTSDNAYVDWCGQLAADNEYGQAWVMCNGRSASNTINSCNGFSCTSFADQNGQNGRVFIDQPGLWTEHWLAWYETWGDLIPESLDGGGSSLIQSNAFVWLQWMARGGSHHNLYMAFGGNNFGRTQGAATQPWYYTEALIGSDGLGHEPMRTHFRNIQLALSASAPTLLNWPAQVNKQVNIPWCSQRSAGAGNATCAGPWSTTGRQYAFAYGCSAEASAEAVSAAYIAGGSQVISAGAAAGASCVVFLENVGDAGVVAWGLRNYSAAANSVIMIDGTSGIVLADSAAVPNAPTLRTYTNSSSALAWSSWSEASASTTAIPAPFQPVPGRRKWQSGSTTIGSVINAAAPLEQLNITEDDTEHVYYAATVAAGSPAMARLSAAAAAGAGSWLAVISAKSQALDVFLGGVVAGHGYDLSEAHGAQLINITLAADAVAQAVAAATGAGGDGSLQVTILSESLGIDKFSTVNNSVGFWTDAVKGITSSAVGSVMLAGVDITRPSGGWTMTVGLVGEALQVWTPAGSAKVSWASPAVAGPLTWFSASFTVPVPLAQLTTHTVAGGSTGTVGEITSSLHLAPYGGLSRGHIYVNGYEISRVWTRVCGDGTLCQPYFYLPADILLEGEGANTLVVFDAEGPSDLSAPRIVLSQLVPAPSS